MTVRGIDHIGLTVPDLEAATRFLADALGAEVLYDTLPAGRGPVGGPETEQRLGVPPGTRQLAIRMLALPDGPGIELFAYDPPGRSPALPHDLGWQHLALYVDDLDTTLARAVEAGAHPLAPPHPLPGPEAGPANRFAYLRTPWGSTLELVTYPDPQPYEEETDRRRWRPTASPPSCGVPSAG
ncbi:glyoxalase [Streptomyces sp. CAI-21]|uniref:VOC family protein n=1 Tax=Streptomyces TaxID=1883 RepID=UPI0008F553DA|nr:MULTISPECIES: VOC family protein [Streptomyces]MCO6749139.1 VOC family protein [Streptomyces sp. IpFD-1.1]MCX5456654.1 VOC family protein [Streptomyces sp. FT1]NUW08053.1 glyoxalase [Streptomyces sp. CAI-21]